MEWFFHMVLDLDFLYDLSRLFACKFIWLLVLFIGIINMQLRLHAFYELFDFKVIFSIYLLYFVVILLLAYKLKIFTS